MSRLSCLFALVAALLVVLLASHGTGAQELVYDDASRDLLTIVDPAKKETYYFPTGANKTANDLPYNDTRIAKPTQACKPQQVRLTYWSLDSVLVSWHCCDEQVVNGTPTALNTNGMQPKVYYDTDFGRTATGVSTSYVHDHTGLIINSTGADNNGKPYPSYQSGYINHVILRGLRGGQEYQYKVSCEVNYQGQNYAITSNPYTFKLPRSSRGEGEGRGEYGQFKPLTLGLIADPGQTYNTTDTLENLKVWAPDAVILVGDFCYADTYGADGSHEQGVKYTYQPRWDTWGRLFEPLLSKTPFVHTNGNHEIEKQPNNQSFISYNARFPNPNNPGGELNFAPVPSPLPAGQVANNLYHTTELPGVLVIAISSMIPGDTLVTKDTAQYQWFEDTLKQVDRQRTPWVIVLFHSPWYTSYIGHYKENECMRQTYEQLLKDYNVDLVVNGHVHSYERTNPVFNMTRDDCGPVHLVIGNGGNIEGLYSQFIDDIPSRNGTTATAFCANPTNRTFPPYQPQRCFSYEPNDDPANSSTPQGYCWSQQPEWSAYRDPSFGSGILQILSPTQAKWSWKKRPGSPALDEVTLIRNLNCSSKAPKFDGKRK